MPITCTECGKVFHSLGFARHRTMHYEQKKDRFTIFAGEKYRVVGRESHAGVSFLVIEDEPPSKHTDIIKEESCDHVTDGSPCWCEPRKLVVGKKRHRQTKPENLP